MIKLIKITRKYIEWAYTTDKYNLIFYCKSAEDDIVIHTLIISYTRPLLITQLWKLISQKLKNDRNKQISDLQQKALDPFFNLGD